MVQLKVTQRRSPQHHTSISLFRDTRRWSEPASPSLRCYSSANRVAPNGLRTVPEDGAELMHAGSPRSCKTLKHLTAHKVARVSVCTEGMIEMKKVPLLVISYLQTISTWHICSF